MARPVFSEDERQQLRRKRFEHPHPHVQLRMEVLWLISCGESYSSAARLRMFLTRPSIAMSRSIAQAVSTG